MLRRAYEDDEEYEEEEGEGYLASYSDLVTDLMAVFVLLYSFALLTPQASPKTSGLMEIRDPSIFNSGNSVIYEYVDERRDAMVRQLEEQITDSGLEGQMSVDKRDRNRIVIRMMDSILFDNGKADIKEGMKPDLDSIGDILLKNNDMIKYIHIEGHTDSRPINTAQFPSNWELSGGRASSVVRYLVNTTEIDEGKFSFAGYGEFRPIADNSTEKGKASNRRVEFSIELKEEANLDVKTFKSN